MPKVTQLLWPGFKLGPSVSKALCSSLTNSIPSLLTKCPVCGSNMTRHGQREEMGWEEMGWEEMGSHPWGASAKARNKAATTTLTQADRAGKCPFTLMISWAICLVLLMSRDVLGSLTNECNVRPLQKLPRVGGQAKIWGQSSLIPALVEPKEPWGEPCPPTSGGLSPAPGLWVLESLFLSNDAHSFWGLVWMYKNIFACTHPFPIPGSAYIRAGNSVHLGSSGCKILSNCTQLSITLCW